MVEKSIDKVIGTAKNYLMFLKSKNISFDKAYLFGFFAKENQREYSDIDLAVVADKWLPDIVEAQMQRLRLAVHIDSRIEPHPIEAADFNESNPFASEIIKYGKEIKIN